MSDCIFCKIASGEIKAEFLYEDPDVVAFRDMRPQAPAHILVIPRRHISRVSELKEGDVSLAGHMLVAASCIAKKEGVSDKGYRLVFNCGPDAGQDVEHIHLHLLGGRKMSWPPG